MLFCSGYVFAWLILTTNKGVGGEFKGGVHILVVVLGVSLVLKPGHGPSYMRSQTCLDAKTWNRSDDVVT